MITLETLDRRRELSKRLRECQETREALEASTKPGARVFTGTPHSHSYEDKLGRIVAEIADLDAAGERIQAEIDAIDAEVKAFSESIPDGITRTAFRLRFLRGFMWEEVAATFGPGYTGVAMRKRVIRYLRRSTPRTAAEV